MKLQNKRKKETVMKKLNSVQVDQVKKLSNVTKKEFANIMLKYTTIVASEQLDNLYSEAIELEELGEYLQNRFDESYYSVAADYDMLDSDTIKQAFGFHGNFNLYMDDLGRGLVVEYY